MANFKPIETQEELDALIQSRLERQAKKFDGFISPEEFESKTADLVKREDFEKLQSESKKQVADYQKQIEELSQKPNEMQKTIDELKSQAKQYEVASEKTRIAREKGLPFESVEFLAGETAEEIEQSADKLKSVFKESQTFKMPLASTETKRNSDPKKEALSKMARAMVNKED